MDLDFICRIYLPLLQTSQAFNLYHIANQHTLLWQPNEF